MTQSISILVSAATPNAPINTNLRSVQVFHVGREYKYKSLVNAFHSFGSGRLEDEIFILKAISSQSEFVYLQFKACYGNSPNPREFLVYINHRNVEDFVSY